jgi:hypothetical protein
LAESFQERVPQLRAEVAHNINTKGEAMASRKANRPRFMYEIGDLKPGAGWEAHFKSRKGEHTVYSVDFVAMSKRFDVTWDGDTPIVSKLWTNELVGVRSRGWDSQILNLEPDFLWVIADDYFGRRNPPIDDYYSPEHTPEAERAYRDGFLEVAEAHHMYEGHLTSLREDLRQARRRILVDNLGRTTVSTLRGRYNATDTIIDIWHAKAPDGVKPWAAMKWLRLVRAWASSPVELESHHREPPPHWHEAFALSAPDDVDSPAIPA